MALGSQSVGVSGGGNVDESRRFENSLSRTVKKQTNDSGSCRLLSQLVVLRLDERQLEAVELLSQPGGVSGWGDGEWRS